MPNQLESLARYSVIVADTGDLEAIARFRPRDATTNPSLILKAARDPRYADVVATARAAATATASTGDPIEAIIDHLYVGFGRRILDLVEGRVSTEVDARLSFDTAATEAKARRLIDLYAAAGVPRERVLIKIAATWEGIRAAERLERDGIRCNLTLLFSFAQAVACADAGVTLISPFVGRVYDWHKRALGVDDLARDTDPGVALVTRIWNHFKRHGIRTEVMGASFRKTTQVLDLAGCDLLTISPDLLGQLAAVDGEVTPKLSAASAQAEASPRVRLDEAEFRWQLNDDAMATEKLAEGIRLFHADAMKLRAMLATQA